LPELMMGLLWLIWGGLWLLGDRFAGGQERSVYWTVAPVTVVLLALSAKRVLRAVKARVTYPRVGYAEARTGGWRAAVAVLAVALLLAVFGLSGAGSPQAARAIPAIVSFAIAAVFVLVSRRLGAGYLRWVAVIPAAMGVYAWRAGSGVVPVDVSRPRSGLHGGRRGAAPALPARESGAARDGRMNDLDRIIHEPGRLLIVALLAGVREADFLYLQKQSGLTKGNLSSHIAKLEEAGYVEVEKKFKGKMPLTILRLTRAGRGAFLLYKQNLGKLLAMG
jgi:DNA-binding transcriptional ArsR family regulator